MFCCTVQHKVDLHISYNTSISAVPTTPNKHCLALLFSSGIPLKCNQWHVVRSASDLESPDKENAASDQLAARLAGLQLIQYRTPAKPVRRAGPFLSVPPKMLGSHHRQSRGATPAFKKQRESLAYELFHEYASNSGSSALHALCYVSQYGHQSALQMCKVANGQECPPDICGICMSQHLITRA